MQTIIRIILFLLIASPAVAFDFPWGANPWQGAAGAAAPTYTMTLAIPASDSTLTVDGTPYTDLGSPHTIPGLSGLVNMVVTYGGTEDTTVFTGTDLADVLGTSPNFSIDMDDQDRDLICTFSTATPSTVCVGWDEPACTPTTAPSSYHNGTDFILTRKHTATENGTASKASFDVADEFDSTQDYCAVVLYRDIAGTITLVGQGIVDESAVSINTWSTKYTLIAEGGQTLDFSTSDVLYFGIIVSGDAVSRVGRNDAGGTGVYYDGASYPSGPPSTITFTYIAGRDMGLMLEYTQ